MELPQRVAALELEAQSLEERCRALEREARAPAQAAEAERRALEKAVADQEARLAQFTAELSGAAAPPVITFPRGAFGAATLGLFCWGAFASGDDVARVSVGLFSAVWVAFLWGALRGR